MSYKSEFQVGTAEFRKSVSAGKLRALLSEHGVIEVGRYRSTPDAVVVAPDLYSELTADHSRLEQFHMFLPLLAAALRTGAAIPSETLARLGVDLPDDTWQILNELQARFPVRITHGEDDEPIARGRLASSGTVGELDEELDGDLD